MNSRKNKVDSEGVKVGLESGESEELGEIEKKNTKVGFQFIIRLAAKGPDQLVTEHLLEDIVASFKQFQTAHLNSISKYSSPKGLVAAIKRVLLGKRLHEKLSTFAKFQTRILDEKTTQILNIEELASIYHLPSKSVETPNISWAKSKKLEIPEALPINQGRIIGLTDFRNTHLPFGIKDEDRKRHMYILGKTGSGKSTLLKTMINTDIQAGKGVAVIDPHGDLVEELLDLVPEHRIKDVVYLDPSDTEYPIGLNMLDLKENETRELLADGIVSVFKKFFGTSWGPRLQYILANTMLTLLYCQNVSLLAVQRILIDKNYRKFLLKQVDDPFLQSFWNKEYEDMAKNARLLTEAIAPIQNKVGRFLNSTMVRNMIGQVKSTIDLPDIMNNGKIFLVNLSQGKIGEENSSLLGGMIVTRLYTNAMQRAFMSSEERRDFYVYVDEFQNFATDTFIKILSEARKYGLNLIVTHQYIDQLSEEIQKSIFGNVGTMMNYVVGQHDADKLSKEYAPDLAPEDLVNLERYRLAIKMMIDGAQSRPFTGIALPPNFPSFGNSEKIRTHVREEYATPREEIEEKLDKWSNQFYNEEGKLIPKSKIGEELAKKKKSNPQEKQKNNNEKNEEDTKGSNKQPKKNDDNQKTKQTDNKDKSGENKVQKSDNRDQKTSEKDEKVGGKPIDIRKNIQKDDKNHPDRTPRSEGEVHEQKDQQKSVDSSSQQSQNTQSASGVSEMSAAELDGKVVDNAAIPKEI